VETASLLPAMRETGADAIGLDWRTPLDEGWRSLGYGCAVQGNLDPITLFAPEPILEMRVKQVLAQAAGRAGHIFNLGHGIVPGTPVENVQAVVKMVKALSPQFGPSGLLTRPGITSLDRDSGLESGGVKHG
jgi:uroporphyrinogen decarboxylase